MDSQEDLIQLVLHGKVVQIENSHQDLVKQILQTHEVAQSELLNALQTKQGVYLRVIGDQQMLAHLNFFEKKSVEGGQVVVIQDTLCLQIEQPRLFHLIESVLHSNQKIVRLISRAFHLNKSQLDIEL